MKGHINWLMSRWLELESARVSGFLPLMHSFLHSEDQGNEEKCKQLTSNVICDKVPAISPACSCSWFDSKKNFLCQGRFRHLFGNFTFHMKWLKDSAYPTNYGGFFNGICFVSDFSQRWGLVGEEGKQVWVNTHTSLFFSNSDQLQFFIQSNLTQNASPRTRWNWKYSHWIHLA